jgi:GNAT superfamily N-acetyltransferase
MRIRSAGLATDLALIATRGRVVDRGAYIVTLTPDDPGYYHGNMLVLPAPPAASELAAAIELFAREVAIDPAVRHVTLRWDGATGDAGPEGELARAGFALERTLVMAAPAVAPAGPPPGLELRRLAPDELARAAELAFAIGEPHDEAHRQFLHRRAAWHRDLASRQLAGFWGAFDDRTLVGSLGLVGLGRLARYQDVQTAHSHRRRGVARALLAAAAGDAVAAGAEQLVIQALVDSDAVRIYERAGFRTIERTTSAIREPPAVPAVTG